MIYLYTLLWSFLHHEHKPNPSSRFAIVAMPRRQAEAFWKETSGRDIVIEDSSLAPSTLEFDQMEKQNIVNFVEVWVCC